MSVAVVLPVMSSEQTAAWLALLELHERLPRHWTLVGGQLVHLHCAERGVSPTRPTNDADAVLDVRGDTQILTTFTSILTDLDFDPAGITPDGTQHRWRRGEASIDVLIPRNVGERAMSRRGVTGHPTVATPGGLQALRRSEQVEVTVGAVTGHVLRPSLPGALLGKAAAHQDIAVDPGKGRHRRDFVRLASLVAAADFRNESLSTREKRRLRYMLGVVREDRAAVLDVPDGEEGLNRLERAARLT